MSPSLNIAFRYFVSRKGGLNLVSIISAISLLGYIVGAAALIIVLSVFNGFEQLFMSMYSNFDSDIKITAAEGKTFKTDNIKWELFNSNAAIQSYGQVIEENVLLRYNDKQSVATLKGVDNAHLLHLGFENNIIEGIVDLKNDSQYALVGQGIAYKLGVDPNDLFMPLAIYAPNREASSIISPNDAFTKILVMPKGVFGVQEEVDNKFVLCQLGFAKQLLNRNNEITAIEIKLKNTTDMQTEKQKLQTALGENYTVKTRFEQRDSFYKVMKSEKAISYLILFFILLIAASNTIGSLYILTMEKQRDLLVLKSIGLSANAAAKIFVYEGLIIAFVGGLLGLLVGVLLCFLQQKFGLVSLQGSSDIMFSSYPVKVIWADVALVFFTVIILGALTTIYPAKKVIQLSHAAKG